MGEGDLPLQVMGTEKRRVLAYIVPWLPRKLEVWQKKTGATPGGGESRGECVGWLGRWARRQPWSERSSGDGRHPDVSPRGPRRHGHAAESERPAAAPRARPGTDGRMGGAGRSPDGGQPGPGSLPGRAQTGRRVAERSSMGDHMSQ